MLKRLLFENWRNTQTVKVDSESSSLLKNIFLFSQGQQLHDFILRVDQVLYNNKPALDDSHSKFPASFWFYIIVLCSILSVNEFILYYVASLSIFPLIINRLYHKNNNKVSMEILFGTKTASGTSPCIIKTNSITILCNAEISLGQLNSFWPPCCLSTMSQPDPSKFPIRLQMPSLTFYPIHSVDVVLISNIQDLLGLPYLYSQGFKGRAFATLPVSLLGKSIFLDIVEGIRRANADFPLEKEPPTFYTEAVVEEAMQLLTTVNFKELVTLSEVVKICAISSAFELGACNWNIFVGNVKATYMSLSSMISYRYPQELAQEEIVTSDILILRQGIIRENPDPNEVFDYQLKRLWETINTSLAADPRAKIVMPINVLQLLDMLDMFAYRVNANAEVVLFTEICDALIGYSNTCCEYLSEKLKNKVLSGDEAFSFKKLIQQRQFSYYKDVLHMQKALGDRYKPLNQLSGKIFLATHSNLRTGEAPVLLKGFLQHPTDSVFLILVDPPFAHDGTLAPFFQGKDKTPKTFFNPLDPRISIEDFQKLLNKCKARHVVYPEEYKGFIEVKENYQKYTENSVIQVPLKEVFVPVGIDKSFLAQIKLDTKIQGKLRVSTNDAIIEKPEIAKRSLKELLADKVARTVSKQHFGETKRDLKGIIEHIRQAGMGIASIVKVEGSVEQYEVKTEQGDQNAFIEISHNNKVHIKCDFKELREILVKLYNSYLAQQSLQCCKYIYYFQRQKMELDISILTATLLVTLNSAFFVFSIYLVPSSRNKYFFNLIHQLY
eukprot:TRINITY_DN88246_c4_g1_i1.p2 TRINITY_DN88246_c4_g1~~TRINITY_DN88246_c4_g1_i1.p2  ORF type:complete len:780 (+),score=48.78 TRINITY_DN88246_c4_g1_i1:3253-5592(+)